MKKFSKTKKLAALVSSLALALCSCGQGATSVTADTGVSTGGTTSATTTAQTSATTQSGTENPGFTIPAPTVKGYLRIVAQSVFEGKVTVDGKIETKMMRVAVLASEKILNQTITYIDVIDDDGTILASTMMGGYGFFAVSTGENTATALLRYSIDLVGDRFTLATTMGEFSDIGSDGKPKDKLSFVTYTNKNATVSGTEDGLIFAQDQIEMFSREAADFIEEGGDKWKIIAVSGNSKGVSYSSVNAPSLSSYKISEMIPQIRSVNCETLKKIVANHLEMEEAKEELAGKSEKMLNSILAGDFDATCDMMANFTPGDNSGAQKEFSEFQSILEGVESFKLENYWRGKYSLDDGNVYSCCFMMTTDKGVFIVEIMQEVGAEKLLAFRVSRDIGNIFG